MSANDGSRGAGAALSAAKRLAPVIIVVAALGSVAALWAALPAKPSDQGATKPPPVPVEVEQLRAAEGVRDELVLHGVVKPYRTVMVAAEVSGQIESYGKRMSDITVAGIRYSKGQTVVEGQPVAAGDQLVVLNTDLLQADYDRTKAQTDYDQREYARMQELYQQKVAAQQELDQAATALELSKAAFTQAAQRLRRTTITAPISGMLNDLPQEIGQYVQPGDYVGEIVDIATAKVVVDVPERDVHFLRVGDAAEVLLDFAGQDKVAGTITFVSELADPSAHTTPVEISVDNSAGALRSGQIVRARLTRRILNNVVMVPLSAVIPLEDGYVVYVADAGVARRREVKIDMGFIKGARVRVTEGLSGSESLIISGQRYVADGQEVNVVASPEGVAEGVVTEGAQQ
jgi:membrane fusion protein (multidrug efflux system)